MKDQQQFVWQRQPEAEKWLIEQIDGFCAQIPFLAQLDQGLREKTSTRLFDWIDHLVVPTLGEVGYEKIDGDLYGHPSAQLPRVLVARKGSYGVAIKVDSIEDFLAIHNKEAPIKGEPWNCYRSCQVEEGVWIIERRGTELVTPQSTDTQTVIAGLKAWKERPRGVDIGQKLAEELVASVGQDLAAWIVLEGERHYWQSRNRAAQIQKRRQDALGMGWANHDHHTFRSSRHLFHHLVHLFETLGFHCRERFYAGEEAGWGAQVMENLRCPGILFLDVDLSPEEVSGDFSHSQLADLDHLGTVGLWCALHGDSIQEAGMHHLEAQFNFEQLTADLKKENISMMDPFSNFSYLKQAFTEGEMWKVDSRRIQELLKKGLITEEQAIHFREKGAVGSHLENLQRAEGYKGFNQKNVSFIIQKTDPRKY